MKYRVEAKNSSINQLPPMTLDKAVEEVKRLVRHMTFTTMLAQERGDDDQVRKNVETMESVKIVEVTDGQ